MKQKRNILIGVLSVFILLHKLPAAVADDHGNDPATATPVTVGSVTPGVIEIVGDVDYFAFTVSNTANYVIYTRGTMNSYGTLYNSSYSAVTSDFDDGENTNFRIVRNLTPGTYYVEVSKSGGFVNPENYELRIEGPGAGMVSDDHGYSPWSATTVGVWSITSGVIDSGDDADFFRFTVNVPGTHILYT